MGRSSQGIYIYKGGCSYAYSLTMGGRDHTPYLYGGFLYQPCPCILGAFKTLNPKPTLQPKQSFYYAKTWGDLYDGIYIYITMNCG